MNALASSLLALFLLSSGALPAQETQSAFSPQEIERAARDFAAARAASDRDGGKLWQQPLYGPILLVDPESRRILANQVDAEGRLKANAAVFVGRYPDNQAIANTAVEWAGVRWAMILLPLPDDSTRRLELIEHELFHRLQPALGLPLASYTIAHLDGLEGRTLLRLEWRALREAMGGVGDERNAGEAGAAKAARRQAIEEALVFRARRRALFPAGAENERALEMNEGLAEDTGCAIAAATPAERRALALTFLASGEKRPSFARSFAYASGPAYGLLLDGEAAGWRKGLDPKSDLGSLLARAIGFEAPANLEIEAARRAARYGGEALRAEEQEREGKRLEREAASRKRFVEGPILILQLHQPQVSFDPNALEPLAELGTVYRTLEVSETWGTLTVQGGGGALLTSDWTRATLSAPRDRQARPLVGDGWTLKLNPGWTLAPGARAGDATLVEDR
jgi:hypothetical protein